MFNCSRKTSSEFEVVTMREEAKKGGAIDMMTNRPVVRRRKLLVG